MKNKTFTGNNRIFIGIEWFFSGYESFELIFNKAIFLKKELPRRLKCSKKL